MSMYTDAMKAKGTADALDLRERAAGMDGTAIIAEEQKAPAFDGTKDYYAWPVGAPVQHEGQVYKLLQPHNAANYEGSPSTLPALWSITHTKDPAKAKPYMAPSGTSGMYMKDECCLFDGTVYICTADNNAYTPEAMPEYWQVYTPAEMGEET